MKTIDLAVKVGLGMALLAALIDVPHCAFSRRPVAGFLIDHLYNSLVFVVACVSFVYFGWRVGIRGCLLSNHGPITFQHYVVIGQRTKRKLLMIKHGNDKRYKICMFVVIFSALIVRGSYILRYLNSYNKLRGNIRRNENVQPFDLREHVYRGKSVEMESIYSELFLFTNCLRRIQVLLLIKDVNYCVILCQKLEHRFA